MRSGTKDSAVGLDGCRLRGEESVPLRKVSDGLWAADTDPTLSKG